MKKSISSKKSLSVNIKSQIDSLKRQLAHIDVELSNLPTANKVFTDEVSKYVFIGEIKSQIAFYEDKWNILEEQKDTSDLFEQISQLSEQLKDTEIQRKVVLQILTDTIQTYFDQCVSMGVYSDYKVHFDEISKVIKLREPNELLPRADIGSKSNYMFLHLFLFLGLHDHTIRHGGKYIPQFLILDQPSQPYLDKTMVNANGEIESDDDRATIKDSFRLLNNFISSMKARKKSFQIILLEHASKSYWESPLLENFHLVDEFRDGNALILPAAMVKEETDSDGNRKLSNNEAGDNKRGNQGDLFDEPEA